MGMIKDKVTFCKNCGSFHRLSYNCSPDTTEKEVEVVQNLAESTPADEAVTSVTEADDANVVLVEVPEEDENLIETVLEVVEDAKVTPEENREILKEVSETVKKKRTKKVKEPKPSE